MDSASIDRLAQALASRTTRRAGLRSFAAGLIALAVSREDGAAKRGKKKRRKRRDGRCLRLAQTCKRGGGARCCDGLACDLTAAGGIASSFCCHRAGTPCASAAGCCSGTCDFLVEGGTCAPCRGRSCSAERPCCGGQECRDGYCGGCRDRATACSSNTQCCFSDCTSGACLSASGGPCARDVDCRACYLGHNCDNACVNGLCTA